MLCYKNGGLIREAVRDTHTSKSWDEFNNLLKSTPPGNNNAYGFYFHFREIIPDGVEGEFFFRGTQQVQGQDLSPAEHARAVLESQVMSVKTRLHTILHGDDAAVKRCIITGGSSTNETFQQVCADILGHPVYVAEASGSATVGGALLARWGWYRASGSTLGLSQEYEGKGEDIPFEATREGGGVKVRLVAEPHPDAVKAYDELAETYQQNEDAVVKLCKERDAALAQPAVPNGKSADVKATASTVKGKPGLLKTLLRSLGFGA